MKDELIPLLEKFLEDLSELSEKTQEDDALSASLRGMIGNLSTLGTDEVESLVGVANAAVNPHSSAWLDTMAYSMMNLEKAVVIALGVLDRDPTE